MDEDRLAKLESELIAIDVWNSAYFRSQPSVVTPKPANGGQGKTGQRKGPGTKLFYPAACCGGKSIFVRQLRGPHLST